MLFRVNVHVVENVKEQQRKRK